jgi:hypothetical protein
MNEKDYLYIIVPYFNFFDFDRPKQNLISFINNNNFSNKVRLIISEGVYGDKSLDIKSNKIFNHLKFKLNDIIWVKENLINLAIKNLPSDWKYVLWCDKDILFKNNDWAEKSIEKLSLSDVIQPWSRLFLLQESQRKIPQKINQLTWSESILFLKKENIPNHAHCGMAWGINRNFYQKINKILDWQIVGQADVTFAFCCGLKDKQKLLSFAKTKTMGDMLLEYAENFNDVKYDYVQNDIYHLFHGELKSKNYFSRLEILSKYNYNPYKDICYDSNGVLCLTKKGKRMSDDIKEYFFNRNEDNK